MAVNDAVLEVGIFVAPGQSAKADVAGAVWEAVARAVGDAAHAVRASAKAWAARKAARRERALDRADSEWLMDSADSEERAMDKSRARLRRSARLAHPPAAKCKRLSKRRPLYDVGTRRRRSRQRSVGKQTAFCARAVVRDCMLDDDEEVPDREDQAPCYMEWAGRRVALRAS